MKRCGVCSVMLPVGRFRVQSQRNRRSAKIETYLSRNCRRCEQERVDHYRKYTPSGVAAEIYRRLKCRSKAQGLQFDLTKAWIVEQLDSQKYCCALTGIEMACSVTGRAGATEGYQWNSISADQINSHCGYTKANVRFVLNIVNLFKHSGDDARMYFIAEALLRQRAKREEAS